MLRYVFQGKLERAELTLLVWEKHIIKKEKFY